MHAVIEKTTIDATSPRPTRATACVVGVEGIRGVFMLEPGEPLSIGRSSSSGICVDDAAVSRLHATLTWDGSQRVVVRDHGSRNGTTVAGSRIEGEAVLGNAGTVGVGPARFFVVLPSRESAVAPGAMGHALMLTERAAQCELNVLLLGETGTGKEVLARRIHEHSRRHKGPFVAVNCGSISESLAEATLFGHERGSFTGAAAQRPGIFEAAEHGTLFLDEIGELPLAHQARLLRVLEQREVTRVGGTRPTPVDIRVVAATHRDLEREVARGNFRRDLLYRIDVLRIGIPPLRDRMAELPQLVRELLADVGGGLTIDDAALQLLAAQPFPGNVRELRNVLARAGALGSDSHLDQAAIASALGTHTEGSAGPLKGRVELAEREAIEAALAGTGGNQTQAARRLGISRRALLYKMQRYGLSRASKDSG